VRRIWSGQVKILINEYPFFSFFCVLLKNPCINALFSTCKKFRSSVLPRLTQHKNVYFMLQKYTKCVTGVQLSARVEDGAVTRSTAKTL